MRDTVRNFLIGLTALGALVGLSVLMLFFGELEPLLTPRYPVTIHTLQASGLRRGSQVELNGVPIGIVGEVTARAGGRDPVRVVVMIDQGVDLPTNARLYAETSLLGGAAILQFVVDGRSSDDPLVMHPHDGTAEVRSEIRYRLFDEITAELDARMLPIERALVKFTELSDTYIEFGTSLNALIGPETADQPSLRTIVGRLDTVMTEIHEALRLASSWLEDEQLRLDARTAVSRANTLIERATDAVDRYARLATKVETDADSLTKRVLPVVDELAATLESVRALVDRANEGEGSIAQALNNPDLYNSLNDAAIRLERVLREAQLLIDKIRAEGFRLGL